MHHYDVVVLGAGFSGVCAGIKLKQAGIENFHIFEKGEDVGGTWRENTYPGVACDVPSHLYSFSFALNPNWSRHYAPGHEIKAYIERCVDDFGIREHLTLGAAIRSVSWCDNHWLVEPEGTQPFTANSVIAALGGLHSPHVPQIPGTAKFKGPMFHTAEWQHKVMLGGKRVGVIGTGATAVQVVPELAKEVSELFVFQRSPVWVGYKKDPEYTPEEKARFENDPAALKAHRQELWETMESMSLQLHTPGTRVNQLAAERAKENIERSVADAAIARLLTPDHNFACKRPTISSQYYQAFDRDNVTLVDGGVDEFTESAAIAGGRAYELDVIVLATGFRAFTITNQIDVAGLDALDLGQAWREQVNSYKSVMVHGFPNFFLMMGPNSTGLQSAIEGIERQASYAVNAIQLLKEKEILALHPRKEAVDAFTKNVQARFKLTTHSKGCSSWWNESGINHSLWPASTPAYDELLREVVLEDFEILRA